MRTQRAREIVVPLADARSLFVEPDTDFFSLDTTFESGIEHLLRVLRADRLAGPVRAVFLLPPDQLQPDLDARLHDAIQRYCRTRILASKATLSSMLWVGLKALQIGVLFLTGCLTLAALIDRSGLPLRLPANVASEGLTVIGWVSLWRPVEIFLYEWWPLWRDARVYDYILRMEIATGPRDEAPRHWEQPRRAPRITPSAVERRELSTTGVGPT